MPEAKNDRRPLHIGGYFVGEVKTFAKGGRVFFSLRLPDGMEFTAPLEEPSANGVTPAKITGIARFISDTGNSVREGWHRGVTKGVSRIVAGFLLVGGIVLGGLAALILGWLFG